MKNQYQQSFNDIFISTNEYELIFEDSSHEKFEFYPETLYLNLMIWLLVKNPF